MLLGLNPLRICLWKWWMSNDFTYHRKWPYILPFLIRLLPNRHPYSGYVLYCQNATLYRQILNAVTWMKTQKCGSRPGPRYKRFFPCAYAYTYFNDIPKYNHWHYFHSRCKANRNIFVWLLTCIINCLCYW